MSQEITKELLDAGFAGVRESINDLRAEMNIRLNDLRVEMNQRFDKVDSRLAVVEQDTRSIKSNMISMTEVFGSYFADHQRRIRKLEDEQVLPS